MRWPYANETGIRDEVSCDVLVLGGGIAGCWAAIAAARKGADVVLVEKGATVRSGAAGSGCDHWENCATNPGSTVSPEELTAAMLDDQDGYNNAISHYIECREGYDRVLDLESFGGKVRDTADEFSGARFRDASTKLMYAYDYRSRTTLRVWGTTFKPALYRECRRLGVRVFDRTAATSLLVGEENGVRRGAGATGLNVRTGRFTTFRAKATVLCMSRPARIWLFNPDLTGLSEFRPPQCIGTGHAMGWRAGLAFAMMEKSVPGEFSAAGRSFPPYSTGNNHNTWFAATMVDADGREVPYVDRDGREVVGFEGRNLPAPGQRFFLMGGGIDAPKYAYQGPDIPDFGELVRRGYRPPFYADLSRMPEEERRVIWGMMVGEEGKTRIPVLEEFRRRGFDPTKHKLQSYGSGWKSASFLPQERQLFGLPGGLAHDWDLKTTLDGVYAAGDQLFASNCMGHAAATGHYAGRHAADHAAARDVPPAFDASAVETEHRRVLAPMTSEGDLGWKELNMAIAKAMQLYCGSPKHEVTLGQVLALLEEYEREQVPQLHCDNPHDLMRTLEVVDILTVSKLILHACLSRRSSSRALCFDRADFPEVDPERDRKFILVRNDGGRVRTEGLPLDFHGDLEENYARHNPAERGGGKG